ncbi:MAG: hypothetical protein HYV07_06615 [Deltaproteobacteria bacterium]|nr:hypothetical protein [Deltaproteobacteria bacterium]
MKLWLILSLACSSSASAGDLGATPAELEARYGPPASSLATANGMELRFVGPSMSLIVRFEGPPPSSAAKNPRPPSAHAVHLYYRGANGDPLGETALYSILDAHGGAATFRRAPAGVMRERWIREDGGIVVTVSLERGLVLAATVKGPETGMRATLPPVPTATRTSTAQRL